MPKMGTLSAMSRAEIEENLKSMSLGDHLEELRARLILMILGTVVGFGIALFFGTRLVTFLSVPYFQAMEKVYQQKYKVIAEQIEADDSLDDLICIVISDKNMRTYQSLKPGDRFYAQVKRYQDDPNDPVFANLKAPSDKIKIDPESIEGLKTLRGQEGMLVYFKVCLVFGFILVCPWVFWQTWAFISAGLYRRERKFIHVVAPISASLFMAGATFFMAVVAPMAMSFFLRFDQLLLAESNWTLQYYIDFVLMLSLIFGLTFQMPIAIVFAQRMGLVSISVLAKSRKYVLLALFVIAAMATPPDVISQVALAVPLYALFEASLVVCRILEKKKSEAKTGA